MISRIMKQLALFIALSIAVYFFLLQNDNNFLDHSRFKSRQLQQQQQQQQQPNNIKATTNPSLKILYIVTSVAEFDTGKRKTIEGRDRYQETLIPVVSESVHSMLAMGYQVDVYLITHYTLTPSRQELLRAALGSNVKLDFWMDATPISYPKRSEGSQDFVIEVTRALSRQHRYVLKDQLLEYDFFVNFEDDMLVKGHHIQQYLTIANEIDRLKKDSPFRLPQYLHKVLTEEDALHQFHGPMSKIQLARMIPGFIRVERVSNATAFQKRTRPGRLPVQETYLVNDTTTTQQPIQVDPIPCCQRPGDESVPRSDDLFLWETHVKALGIRYMPQPSFLNWVLFQQGTSSWKLEPEMLIGDYWAGRDGDFVVGNPTEDERPDSMESIYANNMGGWMASRDQIWTWHTRLCFGGFLPPFDEPAYPADGMNRVVEYWSGGGNLYGRLACNLQRIIPLDPPQFSRHLLYHTSNNKQKQLKLVKGLFSHVNTFLGQLHTVQQRAETVMLQEQAAGNEQVT